MLLNSFVWCKIEEGSKDIGLSTLISQYAPQTVNIGTMKTCTSSRFQLRYAQLVYYKRMSVTNDDDDDDNDNDSNYDHHLHSHHHGFSVIMSNQ